jgi:hypothetical protein
MMAPDIYYYVMLGSLVGSGGVAWGTARTTVARNERTLDKHIDDDNKVHKDSIDRLARIETKLDILMERRDDGLR